MLKHPSLPGTFPDDDDAFDFHEYHGKVQNGGRDIHHPQRNLNMNLGIAGQGNISFNNQSNNMTHFPETPIPQTHYEVPTAKIQGNSVPISMPHMPVYYPIHVSQTPNTLTDIAGAQSLPQYPYMPEVTIDTIKTDPDPSLPPVASEEIVESAMRTAAGAYNPGNQRPRNPKVMRLHAALSQGKSMSSCSPISDPEDSIPIKDQAKVKVVPQQPPRSPMYIEGFEETAMDKTPTIPEEDELGFQ